MCPPALQLCTTLVLATNLAGAELDDLQELGIGVDELVKRGYMDHLKSGPVFWLDTADSQPCLGTGKAAARHCCPLASPSIILQSDSTGSRGRRDDGLEAQGDWAAVPQRMAESGRQ